MAGAWGYYRCAQLRRRSSAMPTIIKKACTKQAFFIMVGAWGFEPQTHWLRVSCSTNWATHPTMSDDIAEYKPAYFYLQAFFSYQTKKTVFLSLFAFTNPYILNCSAAYKFISSAKKRLKTIVKIKKYILLSMDDFAYYLFLQKIKAKK